MTRVGPRCISWARGSCCRCSGPGRPCSLAGREADLPPVHAGRGPPCRLRDDAPPLPARSDPLMAEDFHAYLDRGEEIISMIFATPEIVEPTAILAAGGVDRPPRWGRRPATHAPQIIGEYLRRCRHAGLDRSGRLHLPDVLIEGVAGACPRRWRHGADRLPVPLRPLVRRPGGPGLSDRGRMERLGIAELRIGFEVLDDDGRPDVRDGPRGLRDRLGRRGRRPTRPPRWW